MDKKLRNSKIDRILWIDLEMSGLNPDKDIITEVAAIVTDWDFNEIDNFTGIVKNKLSILNRRFRANGAFWDANPEARDGLLAQNDDGKPLGVVENDLIEFIAKNNFDLNKPVLLAGNSVHVDRRFIIKSWPKFDSKLHYRMLDVTAFKLVFENKYKTSFPKPDTHRALDDIRGSILELKYYLAKVK